MTIQYTGMLQWAESLAGPWYDYADATQSPVTVTVGDGLKFFRSKTY
jgi:hypothetical protein